MYVKYIFVEQKEVCWQNCSQQTNVNKLSEVTKYETARCTSPLDEQVHQTQQELTLYSIITPFDAFEISHI